MVRAPVWRVQRCCVECVFSYEHVGGSCLIPASFCPCECLQTTVEVLDNKVVGSRYCAGNFLEFVLKDYPHRGASTPVRPAPADLGRFDLFRSQKWHDACGATSPKSGAMLVVGQIPKVARCSWWDRVGFRGEFSSVMLAGGRTPIRELCPLRTPPPSLCMKQIRPF